MIVHSVHNNLDNTADVRVEGIDGIADSRVELFAAGAAGLRNAGHNVTHARVASYYDDTTRDIPEGDDTSNAMGATVICTFEEPS